jgi:hypothetical protein
MSRATRTLCIRCGTTVTAESIQGRDEVQQESAGIKLPSIPAKEMIGFPLIATRSRCDDVEFGDANLTVL